MERRREEIMEREGGEERNHRGRNGEAEGKINVLKKGRNEEDYIN